MRIKSFEFNIKELAGSMGNLGTVLPLAIGYIVVCGLDPAGLLIMIGIACILSGVVFKLPMSVEPMKVIAVVAIAQQWSPSMVYASGVAMGVIWLVFYAVGVIRWIEKITPVSVVNGIQVALGIMLAIKAFDMIYGAWILGLVSVITVLLFRNNRYAPAAILLILFGVLIVFFKGDFQQVSPPSFAIPKFASFTIHDMWQSLILAGFAQIPLTITNATIATSSLVKTYWPGKQASSKKLSLSHGFINTLFPLLSSMPLCHGAGGLVSKYYYGARTGGANFIEGFTQICVGLFFSASIVGLLTYFPMAIVGGMMFLVGVELTKSAWKSKLNLELIPMIATVVVAVLTNMGLGFLAGLLMHYLVHFIVLKFIR
jgi:hypothetical protein